MLDLKGKKLLILGGAFQHCKLVEAAKELGVITYVTDYLPLEEAPAKQIADKYYMHNITDFDDIIKLCQDEEIDGVISTSLDACQRPYQQLCEKLDKPCFGTKEQYQILTDKNLFKKYCRKNGVDVIPEYKLSDFETEDICKKNVSFPILIKPCDSRGSRGQSICNNFKESLEAITFAQKESSNGEIVIEKYMGQNNDFSMTIIVINGKAYTFRTVDRILGKYEDGLDKLAVGSVSPSIFTDLYLEKVHKSIENFIKDIGLVNAPVFMQGFVDGNTVRFYDPGLRFPGGEFERMFKAATGKNVFFPLIEFALTGQVSDDCVELSENDTNLNGKFASQILPALRPGKISEIKGMDEMRKHPFVVSAFERYNVGDEISETHNVNQRFAEINIVAPSISELQQTIDWIYNHLFIYDDKGSNMIVSKIENSFFNKYQ